MASLRRMPSLDYIHSTSSSLNSLRTTHLVRHSSLPNLFLCQPELPAMGASSNSSSLNKSTFYITDVSRSCKHTVGRAMSSNHGFEHNEIPEYEKPVGVGPLDAHANRMSAGFSREQFSPLTLNKKVFTTEPGLDEEKSVVYSDLRESMRAFGAPPRFFKPHTYDTLHVGGKASEKKSPSSSYLHDLQTTSANTVRELPMSLRMLKQKHSKNPPQDATKKQCKLGSSSEALLYNTPALEPSHSCGVKPSRKFIAGVGDSIFSAFTSLVYMLKMLQQYAFSPALQGQDGVANRGADENTLETRVSRAYMEMLDSFLWLFQQVFSCTPKLMLLTMMLLADFTLHSVSQHAALPAMPFGQPPTAMAVAHNNGKPTINMGGIQYTLKAQQSMTARKHQLKENFRSFLHGEHGGGGGGNCGLIKHGSSYSGDDGFPRPLRKMTPESRVSTIEGDDVSTAGSPSSALSPLPPAPALLQIVSEMKSADLDSMTKNMLVAPVRAPALEADNYTSFDRTDLAYQHEISMDPSNSLLLANYAQFLHVVRHDHGRAEKLYRRAMMAEAHVDGELMGRFANFLWIVKGNVEEADDIYRAAIEADPSNVYHAGCYAHFLWNSSACNQAD